MLNNIIIKSQNASAYKDIVEAAYYVDFKAVQQFVAMGADVNTLDGEGCSVLYAFLESYSDSFYTPCLQEEGMLLPEEFYLPLEERKFPIGDMILWFLEHGADINLCKMVDGCADNPLSSAVWADDLPMVRLLLSHGADPNILYCESDPYNQLLLRMDMYDFMGYQSEEHLQQIRGIEAALIEFGAIFDLKKD